MTATHPPVIPLKPVRAGRPQVRVPAPEVVTPTPEVTAPVSVPGARTTEAERRAALTRDVFRGVVRGLRISTFVVLALVVYFAWLHGWVGSAADAVVAWYSTNVVPHLEIHFVEPAVPTVQDGLVGPMNEPALVTVD